PFGWLTCRIGCSLIRFRGNPAMNQRPLVAIVFLSLVVVGCSAETRPATEAKAPVAAAAATSTTDMEAAIARHVKNVKAADIDGVLADYADDAILVSPPGLVTPVGTFVGKDKVREFFVWLATPAVLPGAQSMVTTNEVVG